jgi:hypothetical protein
MPDDQYDGSTRRWERRVQLFHTPYSLDTENQPHVLSVNGGETAPTVGYGETFTVEWDGPEVTSVVLVAPSSETHGYNTNQRVVILEITERNDAAKSITVKTPEQPGVAPPQSYMVFALNGKTHGRAKWVHLDTDTAAV